MTKVKDLANVVVSYLTVCPVNTSDKGIAVGKINSYWFHFNHFVYFFGDYHFILFKISLHSTG